MGTHATKARGALGQALAQRAIEGQLMPREEKPKTKRGNAANLTHMGKGRPKGAQNKFTKEVKEVIAQCFDDIGGRRAFAAWARKNQSQFYRLYSKLLPIQLQGSGANGEIQITISADDSKL